jgi:hypothetical protein
MLWVIQESDDCGVRWRRAELTDRYLHPGVALLEALAIIEDEWRPPARAMRELTRLGSRLADSGVCVAVTCGVGLVGTH